MKFAPIDKLGGPVYPSETEEVSYLGIAYIDHVAIEAMKVMLQTDPVGIDGDDQLARVDAANLSKRAYLMAEAMLEERNKRFT